MEIEKIGVIDSGLGGLSLVKQMKEQELAIECHYICDHINVPYGQKGQAFMLAHTRIMVNKLIKKDIKNILIACNTLTAETIEDIRNEFKEISFTGIEPFINYLNHPLATGKERIGLILTQATYKSARFKFLLEKFDGQKQIDICPLEYLAVYIENHFFEKRNHWNDIEDELEFIKRKNWSHIILGCTHYPLITEYFENEFNLMVIDPHLQVINQLVKTARLQKGKFGNEIFFSSNLGEDWEKKNFSHLLS